MKFISRLPKILAGLFIAAAAVAASSTLTSCSDDDYYYDPYYYSPIVGSWGSAASGFYYNEFTFYSDGTGIYSAYNDFGNWESWAITWATSGNSLNVYFVNTGQSWYYTWRTSGNYLYLTNGSTQSVYGLIY